MEEQLEKILAKLLLPDNSVIKEATKELQSVLKTPGSFEALCSVLGSSQNEQVRLYASIIIRKKIKPKKNWEGLGPDVSNVIRESILQLLCHETSKSVQKGIIQLIAVIAKHDVPDNRWPVLFQFIQERVQSQAAQERELSMRLLEGVTSTAAEELKPHYASLLGLAEVTLGEQENPMVPFYTIQTLTSIVPYIGSNEQKHLQKMIPRIVEVIQHFLSSDEEKAVEAMDVLEELLESEVGVIVPHLRNVLEFCMQVASNTKLDNAPRVKALSFISTLAKEKRKSLIKLKLVSPLINTLFPIMCQGPTEEEEEEEYDEAEAQSPATVAGQAMDCMSLHLPPEKFLPPLMRVVEPALQSPQMQNRRAAFMALAVVSEGCSEHIKNKLLKTWLQYVYRGLQDAEPSVRAASMFALGQFSEYLQPNVGKYSKEFLPILFEYLSQSTGSESGKDMRNITKTYYALESFVENLDEEVLPYLEPLMNYLLDAISRATSPRAQELAISALGGTVAAAGKNVLPYFDRIVNVFKIYLQPSEDEHKLKVLVQAIDTYGVLARTLGEQFKPLAQDCAALGVGLLQNAEDPDLRSSVYGLFAALSTVMKEDIGPYLSPAIEQMLAAVKSNEGVQCVFNEEGSRLFNLFEDEDQIGTLDDELDVQGGARSPCCILPNAPCCRYSVENAYINEKEVACDAIGEIAVNSGKEFVAHMHFCYSEMLAIMDYPDEGVRGSVIKGLGQLCIACNKLAMELQSEQMLTAVQAMLCEVMPLSALLVKEDKSLDVAMAALETIKDVMDEVKGRALTDKMNVESLMSLVREVMHHKTACQDELEEGDQGNDDDDEEAELDSVLIGTAGDLLPVVAKVVGGEQFSPYFQVFLPDLLKKTKKSSPVSERSFAVGTIAETLDSMGDACISYIQSLGPIFLQLLKDEDDEVRSNTCYALGVLAANGKDASVQFFPTIIKHLLDILKHESNGRVQDNVCAALCRMILASPGHVPLQQVMPVIMSCLPLKEDLEEYITVLNCLRTLYLQNTAELQDHIGEIARACAHAAVQPKVKEELTAQSLSFLEMLHQSHGEIVAKMMSSQPGEVSQKLQSLIQNRTQ